MSIDKRTFPSERTPLLGDMEDPKMGISTQTLVSSPGAVQAKQLPQYIAALAVTLGAFGMGTTLGWTSPGNPALETKGYSDSELSWVGACMPIGALIVVLPMGYLIDAIGRKKTMLLLVPPFIGGWAFLAWGTDNIGLLCVGRILTGAAGGAFSLTAPVYTSEIAQKEIRGSLGSYFQLMVTIGILFVYALGTGVELFWISIICAIGPLAFCLAFIFMPDTPLYHLRCGREDEARKALQFFRGKQYDVDAELNEMKANVERDQREKTTLAQAFSNRAAKKGLFISFGLMIFQQLSGVNAVIFYTSFIFQAAGSTIEPAISVVIVGVMQVVATFVSTLVVDRLGRRILLLLSDSVMAVCTLLLGIFFHLQLNGSDVSNLGWLPLFSMCLFIIVFSLGYGPIPWMMVGELFPSNIKGFASSLSCLLNWILAFLVTKFFSDLIVAFGINVTFWIFTVISGVGTVFVFFFVPETKGKSLEEVQQMLGGNTTGFVMNDTEKGQVRY